MVITHYKLGRKAYSDIRCDCELADIHCPNDGDFESLCYVSINYLKGNKPPNYPVPATDKVALLSMPYEALTIRTKLWLLDK